MKRPVIILLLFAYLLALLHDIVPHRHADEAPHKPGDTSPHYAVHTDSPDGGFLAGLFSLVPHAVSDQHLAVFTTLEDGAKSKDIHFALPLQRLTGRLMPGRSRLWDNLPQGKHRGASDLTANLFRGPPRA